MICGLMEKIIHKGLTQTVKQEEWGMAQVLGLIRASTWETP